MLAQQNGRKVELLQLLGLEIHQASMKKTLLLLVQAYVI
jgi:hypothetical protein